MIFNLFSKKNTGKQRQEIEALYARVGAQARADAFFSAFGVADTTDGRFDMLVLHLFFVDQALRAAHPSGGEAAQALYDRFLVDMDYALRESGASDPSMPRRMKALAAAAAGRFLAYQRALAAKDEAEFFAALCRNVYRLEEPSEAGDGHPAWGLAAYGRVIAQRAAAFRGELAALPEAITVSPVTYAPKHL